MSSTGSSNSDDRESSDGPDFSDPELQALWGEVPLHAKIGNALDECIPSSLPPEVTSLLTAHEAGVAKVKHLKTSFHKTYLVHLAPPLVQQGTSYSCAIVQIIGSAMGDKAVFGPVPLSAATITKASELASLAGVRVPKILATGQCEANELGSLDFVVEEFIETHTVEDEVCAPRAQWHQIAKAVREKLCSMPLADVDAHPLPQFSTLLTYLQWLLTLVPAWDDDLRIPFVTFIEGAVDSPPAPAPPQLTHQDINGGNLLCSKKSGTEEWCLDALIDWESAAVVDPQLLSDKEPFRTACKFAKVIKGAYLADLFVQGCLPRCELGELIEGYTEASQSLEQGSWIKHETWTSKVARAKAGGKGKKPQI